MLSDCPFELVGVLVSGGGMLCFDLDLDFGFAAESSPEAFVNVWPILGCDGEVAGKLDVLVLLLLPPPPLLPEALGRARFLGLIATCSLCGDGEDTSRVDCIVVPGSTCCLDRYAMTSSVTGLIVTLLVRRPALNVTELPVRRSNT